MVLAAENDFSRFLSSPSSPYYKIAKEGKLIYERGH